MRFYTESVWSQMHGPFIPQRSQVISHIGAPSEPLSLAVPNLGLHATGLKATGNSKCCFINISKLYTQGYF